MGKLEENASNWPHVHSSAVNFLSQENLRCSIPKCNDLMSVTLEREPEWPSKAEISNFNLPFVFIYQEVAWFQVSMHDPSLMAMQQALKHLPYDGLGMWERQRVAFPIQVLLHVLIKVFKDKVKLVLAVAYINQINDSWVAQFFQQRHLSDCGWGYTLVAVLDLYFFQGYCL